MAQDKVVIDIESRDKTKKGIKKAEGSFKGLSATVTKLAAAGFGIAAIKSFGEAMLNANVEVQKLNASLLSVTGSQEKANRAFNQLKEFATTTPFQLNQVVQAFIKMKSLGLDASEEALRSFGNTASAMGKDLNQMIEAVADASTGEFERLKEFGIKARSEGDNVSFTFQGVTTTVQKNAAEITGYLQSIGNEKFGDAMSNQMDTLGGAISNLEDGWSNFLVALGDTGAADFAKESIQALTFALNQMNEALDPTIKGRIADINEEISQLGQLIFQEEQTFSPSEYLIKNYEDQIAALEAQRDLLSKEAKAEEAKIEQDKIESQQAASAAAATTSTASTGDPELDALINQLEAKEAIYEQEASFREQINAQIVSDYEARILAETQLELDQQAAKGKALSDLASLMNSENRKAFETGKVAAIAQATISTYEGATKAYTSLASIPVVGPGLGVAAAAAAIAAGLSNVQKIASTSFGGGGGGGASSPNFTTGGGVVGPVIQPQTAALPLAQGAGLEIRTGGFLGDWLENEFAPAWAEAQSRGVQLVIA